MKGKKLLATGVVVSGVLVSLVFGASALVNAGGNANVILSPTYEIRESIFNSIFEELEDSSASEEELEKFQTLYDEYAVIDKQYVHLAKEVERELQSDERSLEGLDELPDLESLYYEGGAFTDLRPLESLTNLRELGLATENVQNLNSFKKLVNLESLVLDNRMGKYEETPEYNCTVLTDISGLNGLGKLEEVRISTDGNMPTVTLRDNHRKYEVLDPIVLSEHFDGATIQYSSWDESFTNDDGLLKWENIPAGTERLSLNWEITKGSFHYSGYVEIPIAWK